MKKSSFILTALITLAALSGAQVITRSVAFSSTALRQAGGIKGFGVVTMEGLDLTGRVGEPQLPVKTVYICLPPGSEVDKIEAVSTSSQDIPCNADVLPVQPQVVLSAKQLPAFKPRKDAIYLSATPYPGTLAEYRGAGSLGGYRLAEILVYPVQYIPAKRMLTLHTGITLTIYCRTAKSAAQPVRVRSRNSRQLYRQLAERLTGGPVDAPVTAESSFGSLEYLIITKTPFDTVFQRLADWKRQKGVPSAVRSVDWIAANYAGADTQERVRNYLKIAYSDSGLTYLLLGGDCNIVPPRLAFAMSCSMGMAGGRDDIFPCDLYYSDLDGSWNANGNGVYGEVGDSVDLLPDIFVGRASADSLHKARAWVNKLLTYEQNPPVDYQLKALFHGGILWPDPYTNEGIAKDMIDLESMPDRYQILKYDVSHSNPLSEFDAINQGQSIINHDDHGWISGSILSNEGMDQLTNGPRNGILYSIGCWTGAFDYDAVCEHFVNNPCGGGVAYIGNSSFGWGAPGNPGRGYSDLYDAQFFRELFNHDVFRIGMTLAQTKAAYAAHSREENVHRWHQYDINLLGDPEMPVWTDAPTAMVVEHPESLATGANLVQVTVRDGSTPLSDALVCLSKTGEVYASGYTGASGIINLSANIVTAGACSLTVTAHNRLPYQARIAVSGNLCRIGLASHAIDDTAGGNGDGAVNPGEIVRLPVTLRNFGSLPASRVQARLSSSDTLTVVLDSLQQFGDIGPGNSVASPTGYRFAVSPSAANGRMLRFELSISDSQGDAWAATVVLNVATPMLSYVSHTASDSTGNGLADPGDTVYLAVTCRNSGLGLGRAVTCSLSTADTNLVLLDRMLTLGDVAPDSTACGRGRVYLKPGAPSPGLSVIGADLRTSDGYICIDSLVLEVGRVGMGDFVENGTGGWTHGGTNDQWHITTHKSRSGLHSWYCGREGTWQYLNNTDAWVVSQPFLLGPNSTLSFQRMYRLPIYGATGLYVEIGTGTRWDTLDFIGAGGALDSLLGINGGWFQERYDLSAFGYGDMVQVRFTFISDGGNLAEGFYLDDIKVESRQNPFHAVSLSIVSPNGGGVLTGNCAINWTSAGPYAAACSIDVYHSADDGESWSPLALNLPNTGSWQWNTAMVPDGLWNKVGLYLHGGGLFADDRSDSVFVINNTGSTAPEAALISPDGHEVWSGMREVVWYAGDPDGDSLSVLLDCTRDNGNTWHAIGELRSFSQAWNRFCWQWNTVPFPNDTTYKVRVRISDGVTTAADTSYRCFSISNPHDTAGSVGHMSGSATAATIRPYIYDPSQLTGHRYELRFGEIKRGNNQAARYGYELWDASSGSMAAPKREITVPMDGMPVVDNSETVDGVSLQVTIVVQKALFTPDSIKITHDMNEANPPSQDTLLAYSTVDQSWPCRGADYEIRWQVSHGVADSLDTLRPAVWDISNGVPVPVDTSAGWNAMQTSSWAIGPTSTQPGRDYVTSYWPNSGRSFIYICGSRYYFNRRSITSPSHQMTWATKPEDGEVWTAFTSGDRPPHDGDIYGFQTITGVEVRPKSGEKAGQFRLLPNFPNPFGHTTAIRFTTSVQTHAILKVYNVTGQLVRTLVDQELPAGVNTCCWDGRDDAGKAVAGGIYFYRLRSGIQNATGKMLMVR